MAADILMYDADLVPVGKDQKQHLEMTRDIATKFNNQYGNIMTIPEGFYVESQMIVPGVDGRKMSKSYNNYIDPFDTESSIKKSVMRIVTNSAGVNDPKDHTTCNVFKLYSLFSTEVEQSDMISKYQSGIMYSKVKQELFDKIMCEFKKPREEYNRIISDRNYLDSVLKIGKDKASEISISKIKLIRDILGF